MPPESAADLARKPGVCRNPVEFSWMPKNLDLSQFCTADDLTRVRTSLAEVKSKSMNELKRDIEQLHEAGQQLRKGTATGARLALFLMDNLAELLMYRTVLH